MAGIGELFHQEICIINVGLEVFSLELERLGIPVLQVAWSPPAGGDPRRAALLAALEDEEEA
mgnify:CR=1 FL=1